MNDDNVDPGVARFRKRAIESVNGQTAIAKRLRIHDKAVKLLSALQDDFDCIEILSIATEIARQAEANYGVNRLEEK